MSKLRLFGTGAAGDTESIREELQPFLGDADALLVDLGGQFDSIRQILLTMLAVPVAVIGATVSALPVQFLGLLVRRDITVPERADYEALAGDRAVHFVGGHPLKRLADSGWPWLVANWAVILGAAVVDWRSVLLLSGLSLLVSILMSLRRRSYRGLAIALLCVGFPTALWLVVAGYIDALLLGAFALGSMVMVTWADKRIENEMLGDVAAIAADNSHDEVCLVTETGRVREFLEDVEDSDLTFSDGFCQRLGQSGYHVDVSGIPRDQPLLTDPEELLKGRIEARLVDWALLIPVVLIWIVVGSLIASLADIPLDAPLVVGVAFETCLVVSAVIPMLAYYTLTEGMWGYTVGKGQVGLRVVHPDGSEVRPKSAFLRAVGGWIDALPVAFVLGGLVIARDGYGQRIGDKLAGTLVVEREAVTEPAATAAGDHEETTADDTDASEGAVPTSAASDEPDTPSETDSTVDESTGQDTDDQPVETDQLEEPLLAHTDGALTQRCKAQVVDWGIVGVLFAAWVFAELLAMALFSVATGIDIDLGTTVLVGLEVGHFWLLTLFVPSTVYYTVTEGVWGRTIGKRFADLRVVHTDGTTPGFGSALVRTLVGWVDALPVAQILGGALASEHSYGRRLADHAAGTVVVKDEVAREHATEDVGTRSSEAPADGDDRAAVDPPPATDQDGDDQAAADPPPATAQDDEETSGDESDDSTDWTPTWPDDEE